MPCASTHLQLISRGHGQQHTPSSHQQHTLANNNIYPTHGASCSTHNAASRLGHGTNLRLRCFHCRYCATELQRDAVSSHCRRRVEVDQDEDKVKSSRLLHVQSPISNLSRLAARLLLTKPPPNASANALRDFPTQLLSQLLLASASALATGPDEKAADRKSSWPAFLSLQVAQQLTVDNSPKCRQTTRRRKSPPSPTCRAVASGRSTS
jgi:hypothetical protein